MIDDNEVHVQGAQAVGMPAYHYIGNGELENVLRSLNLM